MTKIDVPGVGTISTRKGALLEENGAFRRYTRVGFKRDDSNVTNTYIVGSPTFRFGAEYVPDLYATIHAALAFFDADDENEAAEWASVAIPIGNARIARSRYRVVDDGNGGSMKASVKSTVRNAPVTRYIDEDLGSAIVRSLVASGTWSPDTVFDSCDGTWNVAWHTVPMLDLAGPGNNVWISCVVTWSGDLVATSDRLQEAREALVRDGYSW